MRGRVILSAVVLAALTSLAGVSPLASAAPMSYIANMSGDQEVPEKGPANAKGTANLAIDADAGKVCYQLTYENITKPVAAHIHRGAAGVAGDPVVNFDPVKNGDKACVAGDPMVLREIQADPPGFYVNLHTADHKNGAMRGQLAHSH